MMVKVGYVVPSYILNIILEFLRLSIPALVPST